MPWSLRLWAPAIAGLPPPPNGANLQARVSAVVEAILYVFHNLNVLRIGGKSKRFLCVSPRPKQCRYSRHGWEINTDSLLWILYSLDKKFLPQNNSQLVVIRVYCLLLSRRIATSQGCQLAESRCKLCCCWRDPCSSAQNGSRRFFSYPASRQNRKARLSSLVLTAKAPRANLSSAPPRAPFRVSCWGAWGL